jgi:hypothetical protein
MQPLPELACHGLGVAGADAPRINEIAAVVIAGDQRADRAGQHGRGGIAANHEFLGVRALDLEEAVRPPAAIGRIPPLGDDAFERHLAGMP